jgi:hypothetical protein
MKVTNSFIEPKGTLFPKKDSKNRDIAELQDLPCEVVVQAAYRL